MCPYGWATTGRRSSVVQRVQRQGRLAFQDYVAKHLLNRKGFDALEIDCRQWMVPRLSKSLKRASVVPLVSLLMVML